MTSLILSSLHWNHLQWGRAEAGVHDQTPAEQKSAVPAHLLQAERGQRREEVDSCKGQKRGQPIKIFLVRFLKMLVCLSLIEVLRPVWLPHWHSLSSPCYHGPLPTPGSFSIAIPGIQPFVEVRDQIKACKWNVWVIYGLLPSKFNHWPAVTPSSFPLTRTS